MIPIDVDLGQQYAAFASAIVTACERVSGLGRFSSPAPAASLDGLAAFLRGRHSHMDSGLYEVRQQVQSRVDFLLSKTSALPVVRDCCPSVCYYGAGHAALIFRKSAGLADLQILIRVETAEQFDQFGDQAGPAGLVACSQSSAVITVEVLEEQKEILPVGIRLEFLRAS